MTCVAVWPPMAAFHHRSDVVYIDSVARDLGAVGRDGQAGLTEFAHHGEFSEAGRTIQHAPDLESFALQHIEVGTENLDRQRALQPGEGFVHGVFGGLRVIEDHAGKRRQLLLQIFNEIRLGVNGTLAPGLVGVRPQSDVELAIKKSGGIGAVVRPSEFRTDQGHLRIGLQDVADLGSELAGLLKGNGVGHGGAHPKLLRRGAAGTRRQSAESAAAMRRKSGSRQ